MSDIFPAATVVLVRDGPEGMETLLLRRNKAVKFAGGSWVFPGGRIDKADYGNSMDDIEAAARVAAVRETKEEADLVIDESGLIYFAHWTTPPEAPKRFATWFYISIVDTEQSVVVDPVLIYSSFLGGTDRDDKGLIDIDSTDAVYVYNETLSDDWPGPLLNTCTSCSIAVVDTVLTKMLPDGSAVEWASYLGGINIDRVVHDRHN